MRKPTLNVATTVATIRRAAELLQKGDAGKAAAKLSDALRLIESWRAGHRVLVVVGRGLFDADGPVHGLFDAEPRHPPSPPSLDTGPAPEVEP